VQRREVNARKRLLHESLLLLLIERVTEHFLGREQREISNLQLDAIERLLRLRRNRLLRRSNTTLALGCDLLDQLTLLLGCRSPGTIENLGSLVLRRGELSLVLLEQALGLLAGALGRRQIGTNRLGRSSSSPAIRPKAYFFRMNRTIKNVISVHMLRPSSG